MEAIAIVNIDWRVRMSRTVTSHLNLRSSQSDFVEDSPDREQIFFAVLRRYWRDD